MPASTRPPLLVLLILFAAPAFAGAAEKKESLVSTPPGERVTLGDHLVSGKMVIFVFNSEFCPPCPSAPFQTFEDPLAELTAFRDDVVVVKVDVNRASQTQIDWNSPVSMQFGLKRLPHFIVYGPDGRMLAQDDQSSTDAPAMNLVYDMLMDMMGVRGEKLAANVAD